MVYRSITSEFALNLYRILATIDAKGGGKGNRINAKTQSFGKWAKAEALVENYFNTQGDGSIDK